MLWGKKVVFQVASTDLTPLLHVSNLSFSFESARCLPCHILGTKIKYLFSVPRVCTCHVARAQSHLGRLHLHPLMPASVCLISLPIPSPPSLSSSLPSSLPLPLPPSIHIRLCPAPRASLYLCLLLLLLLPPRRMINIIESEMQSLMS